MAGLKLSGNLNLAGVLKLTTTSGGKVRVDSNEVLVEDAQGTGSPVVQPPPPAGPIDPGPKVKVLKSFNSTVTANGKAIVALGICMQGNVPTWPGMLLPSTKNTGPVTINKVAINVKGDSGLTLPNGGAVTFDQDSGQ
jgi:hypothetical protein